MERKQRRKKEKENTSKRDTDIDSDSEEKKGQFLISLCLLLFSLVPLIYFFLSFLKCYDVSILLIRLICLTKTDHSFAHLKCYEFSIATWL